MRSHFEHAMLVELVIQDLALIERATLSFGPGLNVITGETGAGKTLLVGALELLLGTKPKPGRVRAGATRALVEGRFIVPSDGGGAAVARWARRHMPQLIDEWRTLSAAEERELVVGRSVSSDGKTRAYVNGRPVTRAVLAELAPRLFEIHGQNDHQKLHDPSEQLRLLDGFGELDTQVAKFRAARMKWQKLVDEVLRLEREARDRRDRLELARFQLSEIASVRPEPEERARLAPERELLRHAAGLKDGLARVIDDLRDGDDSLLDRLRRAARFLEPWKEQVGALEGPAEEIAAALVHLEEASRSLAALGDKLEIDPARLEVIEGRLAELERLERKYRAPGDALLEFARELETEIARLERDEKTHAGVADDIARARAEVLASGGELRRARKALRPKLVKAIHKTLKELGLANAEFDMKLGQRGDESDLEARPHAADLGAIEADRTRFGERGMDRIEFVLSANAGEALQKLRQVASGGETARIMLALRTVLAGAGDARTLLFDEIDSGVGGRLGPVVGAHLKQLAEHHQVLVVTHLPAIAAIAKKHLRVKKHVEGGRTATRIDELQGDARVFEIADMIAGGADQETAKAEARRLMASG
jgi:DNA repair protein RecN (Recombination protein N)